MLQCTCGKNLVAISWDTITACTVFKCPDNHESFSIFDPDKKFYEMHK